LSAKAEAIELTNIEPRPAKGERTRHAILDTAVDIASVEGLEGLTIGRLAEALSMSKSGLFAHFGSKLELQLATVDAARTIFIHEVIVPALAGEPGLARLWNLCDTWFVYIQSGVFRGGCFFAAASAEFDSRPGQVRDKIAGIMKEWLTKLVRGIMESQAAGHLLPESEPEQIAFEINSLQMGANWAFQLYGDRQAFDRARRAMLDLFHRNATPAGAQLLPVRGHFPLDHSAE
jgi:AcrR family transcriptional regulator